ncbi:MAG: hypothetical protein Q8O00_07385 [Holophaga sp.]|nr:hypothetical protein [Holophaga sp.]
MTTPCPLIAKQPKGEAASPLLGMEYPSPLTDEILHDILNRKLLNIDCLIDLFQHWEGVCKEDFYGLWEGDPDAWLAKDTLPRIWIVVKGETIPLIRPGDFETFMNLICDDSDQEEAI